MRWFWGVQEEIVCVACPEPRGGGGFWEARVGRWIGGWGGGVHDRRKGKPRRALRRKHSTTPSDTIDGSTG